MARILKRMTNSSWSGGHFKAEFCWPSNAHGAVEIRSLLASLYEELSACLKANERHRRDV
jgi:hypothetical protein